MNPIIVEAVRVQRSPKRYGYDVLVNGVVVQQMPDRPRDASDAAKLAADTLRAVGVAVAT